MLPTKPTLSQRWFHFIFPCGRKKLENAVQQRKRQLLANLSGTVLEIGPGTGANLKYLPADVHFIGVEPNPLMIESLRKEAASLSREIVIFEGRADALPAKDASVDAVISTLVLCSVPSADAAIREAARVLKPGGTFIFIEHVAAPRGSGYRIFQKLVRPLWKWMNDHCDPLRETGDSIRAAGFVNITYDEFRTGYPVVSPHIGGTAQKRER
ncbi:MAG: class I SAM-dependent methyltransferase [Planctomycetota bacterium]